MADHNDLGALGEELAVQFLHRKGYEILERNYTYQKAEIDIIAKFNNEIIIVEVKTRNSNFFGDPQGFVTPAKIKLLTKAANKYIISNAISIEARFDIVAILKNSDTEQIEHFENAFYFF